MYAIAVWMGKVREFKFGVRIDRQAHKPKSAKVIKSNQIYLP